jgi:urease accessory protein
MERDAKEVRGNKPYVLVNCRTGQGVKQVTEHIIRDSLFESAPKAVAKR